MLLVLLTWVTWVDYPSCPKGRDLNFSRNPAMVLVLLRLEDFQELTTLCEKTLDLMSVQAYSAVTE